MRREAVVESPLSRMASYHEGEEDEDRSAAVVTPVNNKKEKYLPLSSFSPGESDAASISTEDEDDDHFLVVEEQEIVSPRRWFVVSITALANLINCFTFMNYSTDVMLSKDIFGISVQDVSWLYSASLLAVLPAFFIASDLFANRQSTAMALQHVLNALASLTRLGSVYFKSYPIALLSSVLVGLGASLLISSYGAVSERWLPEAERSFGVAVLVQIGYVGWFLGVLITPLFTGSPESFLKFMYGQAVVCFCVMMLGLGELAYRTPEGGRRRATPAPRASITTALKELSRRPRWMTLCVSYSIMAGVGFAVPAVADVVMDEACDAPPSKAAAANAYFVGSGVAFGLALGHFWPVAWNPDILLASLFAACTLATIALALLIASSVGCLPPAMAPLMALSGAASVGFVGCALRDSTSRAGSPAAAVYAAGIVELLVQMMGALLTQVSSNGDGFIVIGTVMMFAFLLLLLGQRLPPEPAEPEAEPEPESPTTASAETKSSSSEEEETTTENVSPTSLESTSSGSSTSSALSISIV